MFPKKVAETGRDVIVVPLRATILATLIADLWPADSGFSGHRHNYIHSTFVYIYKKLEGKAKVTEKGEHGYS